MRTRTFLLIAPFLGLSLLLTGCSSGAGTSVKVSPEATPEPIIVHADAGLTLYQDSTTSIPDQKTLKGAVKYPGGQITVLGAGSLEGVPLEPGDLPAGVNWESQTVAAPPETKLPAEGEHFLAYRLKVDSDGTASDAPSFAAVVDGTTRELANLSSGGEHVLVLSVPKNSKEVVLEVRFDGLVQEMNLNAGERTSTTAPALYVGGTSGSLPNGGMIHTETPGSLGTVTFDAAVGTAARSPWWNGLHWANNGESAWVVVDLSTTPTWRYQSTRIASVEDYQENWTLTDSKRNAHNPVPGAIDDRSVLVFQVPSDELQFTLGVSGQGQTWDGIQRDAMVGVTASPIRIVF